MKVYYIAGYGRSGSTLLGRVQGRRHRAVVVGEAHGLAYGTFLTKAVCSCGAAFPNCDYWAALDADLARHGTASVSHARRRWLEGMSGLFVPMFLLRRWVATAAFSTRYRIPYPSGVRTMAAVSGGAFVDTSKTTRRTANRPRLLAAAGLEVEVYVATRPLADVVESCCNARSRRGLPSSRLRSWIVVPLSRAAAHLAARWAAFSLRRRITWVQLDRAAAEIAGTLPGGSHVDHLIAGNRMRHHDLDRSPEAR